MILLFITIYSYEHHLAIGREDCVERAQYTSDSFTKDKNVKNRMTLQNFITYAAQRTIFLLFDFMKTFENEN